MQCLAITKTGLLCTRVTKEEYCWQHLRRKNENTVTINLKDNIITDLKEIAYPDIIKTLIGPVSLTEHTSDKYDKHIYIFGDYHTKKSKCDGVKIDDFIKNLINSDIHLFLEISDFEIPHQLGGNSYVIDVHNNFPDKKRIYGTDNRHEFQRIRDFINSIYEIFLEPEKESINITEYKYFYYTLKANMLEIKNLYNVKKINKQLENITDINLKNIIIKFYGYNENYLKSETPGFIDTIESFFPLFKNTENINISEHQKKILTLFYNKLFYLYDHTFDTFLVSSMFRLYSDRKIKNVVIYFGEAHAGKLRRLLNLLNFTLVQESYTGDINEPNFQCLDISKFKQPFFL